MFRGMVSMCLLWLGFTACTGARSNLSARTSAASSRPPFQEQVWSVDSMESVPEFGQYMYVEEMPQVITRVYPNWYHGIGKVMVQALIGTDGTIRRTIVVKSVPGLDSLAVHAVRQWIWRPAMSGGKPVAVWMAIPIEFPPPSDVH